MNTYRNDLLIEAERGLGVRNGRTGGMMTRREALEMAAAVAGAWVLIVCILLLAQWIGG